MDQFYPVYLVLAPFRDIAPSVRVLVRTLDRLTPYLPMADAYYREDTDEALLGLQFAREAVSRIGAPTLLDVIARCNLPAIVPDKLDPQQREHFAREHLSSYHTYVQLYRSAEPGENLLQRAVTALEEHVESSEHEDDYESVEVSVSDLRPPRATGQRATSQWEMPTEESSALPEPSTPPGSSSGKTSSSEPDAWP